MADIDSTTMANLNATPRVRANTAKGGILKSAIETVEVSTATDAADVIYFFTVPSSASPRALKVWSDAAITSGAGDIGIYRTADDGGAVVDADLFASALAIGGGLTGADQMFESGIIDEGEVGQPLWQLAALSADPNCYFVVAMTVTTDMGAGGTLSVELQYVDTN